MKDEDEINNYVSVYYYKTVDVANKITPTVYSLAKKKANAYSVPADSSFWNDFSYNKLQDEYDILLIPSYTHQSKLKGKNGIVITTYTISNLNSTAQSGEFICNFSDVHPLEEFMVDKLGKKHLKKVEIHKGLIEYILHSYLQEDITVLKEKYYMREDVIAKQIENNALKVI